MNQLKDFLLFDIEAVLIFDSTFLQFIFGMLIAVHTLVWVFVLFLLPFKLLSWLTDKRE